MQELALIVSHEVNKELYELFGNRIDRIILYGSYARGDFNLESDVDMMVLLDCGQDEIAKKRKDISRVASRVGLRNDVMVSLLARNKYEFEANMANQPFYQNIKREGIEVYGKE